MAYSAYLSHTQDPGQCGPYIGCEAALPDHHPIQHCRPLSDSWGQGRTLRWDQGRHSGRKVRRAVCEGFALHHTSDVSCSGPMIGLIYRQVSSVRSRSCYQLEHGSFTFFPQLVILLREAVQRLGFLCSREAPIDVDLGIPGFTWDGEQDRCQTHRQQHHLLCTGLRQSLLCSAWNSASNQPLGIYGFSRKQHPLIVRRVSPRSEQLIRST